jgi:tetratricopeptide (TPR) repeat protein
VDKIGGYLPPAPFTERLQSILELQKLPQLEKQATQSPQNAALHARLARLYAQKGDKEKAKASLDRLVRADPQDKTAMHAKAYIAVADAYLSAEQPRVALPLFEKAITTAKTPAQRAYAQGSIGACYVNLGDRAKAKVSFEKVLKIPGVPAKDATLAKELLARLREMGR